MDRTTRIRRILKWSAATLTLLTIAVFIFSISASLSYGSNSSYWQVTAGGVTRLWYVGSEHDVRLMKATGGTIPLPLALNVTTGNPFNLANMSMRHPLVLHSRVRTWTIHKATEPDSGFTRRGNQILGDVAVKSWTLPLWWFVALAAGSSALLFWMDRKRAKPGHCRRCGYNLTGNVSGTCSECGVACNAAIQ